MSLSFLSLVTGIYGNYHRDKNLTLAHHLSIVTIVGLFALRWWDISTGISWGLVGWFLLGLLLVAVLPFFNKKMSERLYREQVEPETNIGRIIFAISVGIIPLVGIIGASFGLQVSYGGNSNASFMVIGFFMYLATLGGVFFNFQRYAANQFKWLTKKNKSQKKK